MNIFYKCFFLLLSLLILNNYSFATDDVDITSIKLNGYISNITNLELLGENFINCDNLIIDDEKVKFDVISNKLINFSYNMYKNNSGIIFLECSNVKTSFIYDFPIIESFKFDYKDIDRNINIIGKGFGIGSKIVFNDNKKLDNLIINTNSVNGNLPLDIEADSFYIEKNGFKSNIKKISYIKPNITHIKSENGFYPGERIKIYGDNIIGKYNYGIIYMK